ncbi:PDR/VanB family oxidoreductase [Caballeronia sordidicola]|uniref:PDR/VanB family oxidoreductase n=1 Tax=Caballeronia sordidicola TaxID=196367 RepID=UPI0004D002E3|nr:PDR/VanB family oxidoreductase [Caballeronia sordidicola]
MSTKQALSALIRSLRHEADGVLSVELVPGPGAHFPGFEAGAHVDVHLPNGLVRSYSLSNSSADIDRYVLGILEDRQSRGGSKYIHANFRCGMAVAIDAPRNNFRLDENAASSILIAGGIGITPILSMYRRLIQLGRPVKLVYCARSRKQAGFVEHLLEMGGDVLLHFDDEHDGAPIDLPALLERESKDVHAYCCGPEVMLRAFEEASGLAGIANVHVERFAADPEIRRTDGNSYVVELSKSGKTLGVEAGKTLLQTLLDANVYVDHSCEEGVCGSCETRVLSGIPDHRDSVLSAAERAANKKIMVCVSGCKSGKLILDL